jgi:hypothetical protein
MRQQAMDELSRQVPQGSTKLFERSNPDPGEERFFRVEQNWDYEPGRLTWHNQLPGEEAPWFGSRKTARISISVLPPPMLTFDGPASDIVDFYSTGCHAYFLSDRLASLIEGLDPGSLELRRTSIGTHDEIIPFHVGMPARNLAAVDTTRTDVLIEDKLYATDWIRRIKFPGGVVFNNDDLAGIHSFSDQDLFGWYWSRELIDLAKASGIKGAIMHSVLSQRKTVDRL